MLLETWSVHYTSHLKFIFNYKTLKKPNFMCFNEIEFLVLDNNN